MFIKKTVSFVFVFLFIAMITSASLSQPVNLAGVSALIAQPSGNAKYIFLFIGDGMGIAQRTAAELYKDMLKNPDNRRGDTVLLMNTFPAQGITTTENISSIIPDSASAATAISTGKKTASRVLGMDPEGKVNYEYITEGAKARGWKVGILSTVSLDHATPAAFYSHQPSRYMMVEIGLDLANSDFDYFAGGQLKSPEQKGEDGTNALDLAAANGFRVARGRQEFDALTPDEGRVIAFNDQVDAEAAMYYTMDQPEGYITLAEFVEKGIELLDNPTGFFMMAESGKIDWACQAHDAAAAIHEVLAFDEAIAVAYQFYLKHPRETLIIVTADHETGGLAIGYTGTGYSVKIDRIRNQKISNLEFNKRLKEFKKDHRHGAELEAILPLIEEVFGFYVIPLKEKADLQKDVEKGNGENASDEEKEAAEDAKWKLHSSMAFTDLELARVQAAFDLSMLDDDDRPDEEADELLYGGEEPLTATLTTILNEKAGLAWTTFKHTGIPVLTSALGVGAELFNGYYDQIAIHTKMMEIADF